MFVKEIFSFTGLHLGAVLYLFQGSLAKMATALDGWSEKLLFASWSLGNGCSEGLERNTNTDGIPQAERLNLVSCVVFRNWILSGRPKTTSERGQVLYQTPSNWKFKENLPSWPNICIFSFSVVCFRCLWKDLTPFWSGGSPPKENVRGLSRMLSVIIIETNFRLYEVNRSSLKV